MTPFDEHMFQWGWFNHQPAGVTQNDGPWKAGGLRLKMMGQFWYQFVRFPGCRWLFSLTFRSFTFTWITWSNLTIQGYIFFNWVKVVETTTWQYEPIYIWYTCYIRTPVRCADDPKLSTTPIWSTNIFQFPVLWHCKGCYWVEGDDVMFPVFWSWELVWCSTRWGAQYFYTGCFNHLVGVLLLNSWCIESWFFVVLEQHASWLGEGTFIPRCCMGQVLICIYIYIDTTPNMIRHWDHSIHLVGSIR